MFTDVVMSWLGLPTPDEREKLQKEYELLHKELIKTEDACHEVEEAIHHLEKDNLKLAQIIKSRRAEQ